MLSSETPKMETVIRSWKRKAVKGSTESPELELEREKLQNGHLENGIGKQSSGNWKLELEN